jgi:hypothetical protein
MGDDIRIENYKKSVAKILDIWGAEIAKISKDLTPIQTELDKLEGSSSPGPDEKKRIDELKKKRDALRKKLDEAENDLRVNLMVIQPAPDAPEKELIKVPDWMKEIIKRKGLPLGKNVSIAPDIKFDFKSKKLKSIGVTIKW